MKKIAKSKKQQIILMRLARETYAKIAKELGISIEDARQVIAEYTCEVLEK